MVAVRVCPQCGAGNLPERRYCRECGSGLEFRCPACCFANRVGDPRCGGCGAALVDGQGRPVTPWQTDRQRTTPPAGALAPEELIAAENRLATIVKADLSGFTAMSEKLRDPEEVTAIMNQVFEPLVACVRRFGGHVDNYAGDMIISFFGAPRCHEGSAERAVRAALAMREEVARLNDLGISHGVPLGISTGVATGYGLWGQVGIRDSARYTLSGELGDYAALLEKVAESGTVGICPATHARVRDTIPGEAQAGRVTPPGETGERPYYYAQVPPARAPWLDEVGHDAPPWVGDDPALAALLAAWDEACAGHSRIVCAVGEAGCGKTRLLYELALRVLAGGHDVHAVGGRPLSAALADDVATALPASPVRPCLVVVDGLDWVPELPLERLRDWVARAGQPGVLVVLACRAEARLAELAVDGDTAAIHPVAALDRNSVQALAGWRLDAAPGSVLLDWLLHWSEGNPLYVRELCTRLVARPTAAADEDLPSFDEPGMALPWRLQELADQALDALPPPERAVALAAAVAAGSGDGGFDGPLVPRLVADPAWAERLARLEAAGLLERDEAPARWRFRHRLTAVAARRRLVESVRRTLEAVARDALRPTELPL
jgi:class 3 adenylate cyclase